jgi:hypothetical protein
MSVILFSRKYKKPSKYILFTHLMVWYIFTVNNIEFKDFKGLKESIKENYDDYISFDSLTAAAT